MNQFLTSQQNLALSVAFQLMRKSRFDRSLDEYMAIAARAPKQKVLLHDINRALEDLAIAGVSGEICETWRCDKGYPHYQYLRSPVSISRETLRKAWEKSGMRELQLSQKERKKKNKLTV